MWHAEKTQPTPAIATSWPRCRTRASGGRLMERTDTLTAAQGIARSSDKADADMALRPRHRPPPGCCRRARRLLPHHHAHPVRDAIVHEGDGGGIHGVAVQLGLRDPPAAVLRVGNGDVIAGAAETPDDGILGPGRGDAGIQLEARAVALEAEDALQARAVHPARGARVPRPTAAPGVG